MSIINKLKCLVKGHTFMTIGKMEPRFIQGKEHGNSSFVLRYCTRCNAVLGLEKPLTPEELLLEAEQEKKLVEAQAVLSQVLGLEHPDKPPKDDLLN